MSNILSQANRCLKCKVPMCSKFCPIQTPIPAVIDLFQNGKIREAGEILFSNNPLSAICAIICPHEKNCSGHCVLGKKSSPVDFFEIEQYISGFFIETYLPDISEIEPNGFNIAVIGAGPAGISMSILLALKGYSVTLFEKKDRIGGILLYGIPEFRLPKRIVEKYDELLYKLGVKFRPNTPIGQSLTFDDMFIDGYHAIFVATGTSRPNKLGLLGESLGHVHYAVDYLKSPESFKLGKKIVIIGAGNVAIDAARTAVRKSHGEVSIIHHMEDEDMTANREEIEMAKIDGVQFIHRSSTVRIVSDGVLCVRMNVVTDENGKRDFVENFEEKNKIPADSVIIALGQGPQVEVLKSMTNMDTTDRGLISIDEYGNTSQKGIYAAGDIVTGPRTVVEAVALTKKIAGHIDEYCKTL